MLLLMKLKLSLLLILCPIQGGRGEREMNVSLFSHPPLPGGGKKPLRNYASGSIRSFQFSHKLFHQQFVLRTQHGPVVEKRLLLLGQFHKLSICEELAHCNPKSAADCLQSWNRRQVIPAEQSRDCRLRKRSLLCQLIFRPASFAHQLSDTFKGIQIYHLPLKLS